MKIRVIGHLQAVQGFALVGLSGVRAGTEAEVNQALDEALADMETGIIMLTSDAADLIRRRFISLQSRGEPPELLEIPGPGAGSSGLNAMRALVQEAIGVRPAGKN
ncbi:MAG: V-type ATP synthase subunit F [Anaerolineaceae bacterium]|nr:V-type ATP synthase subunit F [Anaerolineaceae bacterium]